MKNLVHVKAIQSFFTVILLLPAALIVFCYLVAPIQAQECATWSKRLPGNVSYGAMAYDSNRRVIVLFGGESSPGVRTGETWEWDGEKWTLRATNGPSARGYHAMAYDSLRGVTVLFGGSDADHGYLDDTWEWDGESWVKRNVIGPVARYGPAMAYDSVRNRTVLFGGDVGGPDEDADNRTWEWDGTAWVARISTGETPHPREQHSMTFDSARNVTLLFGGLNACNNTLDYSDTWTWDGQSWNKVAASGVGPPGGYRTALAFDSSRGVVVKFGGGDLIGGPNNETWEWNGTTWSQRAVGPMSKRSRLMMAFDAARGGTVLFGGESTDTDKAATWSWDGTNWQQKAAGIKPSRRYGHAMTYDSQRNKTVLHGGSDESSVLNKETWEWSDNKWQLLTSLGPTKRALHAMVFNSAAQRALIFGGLTPGVAVPETWSWDGALWTLEASSGPSLRMGHALVYDTARGVVVLFGGANGALARNNETWEWDGTLWSQRTIAGIVPSTRYFHAMAYDQERRVTVLFGGDVGSGGTAVADGETWEWNGTAWTMVSNTGPSPRYLHAMTYDPVRSVVVAVAGGTWATPVNDTWEWDGNTWTKLSIKGVLPSVRGGHAIAYDEGARSVVLFGGLIPGKASDETWELLMIDRDGDGQPDCRDLCPDDPLKTSAGKCGCGISDIDADDDSSPDCTDLCPLDNKKTDPGICGCGAADSDLNNNGVADCLFTSDLAKQLDLMRKELRRLAVPKNKKQVRTQKEVKREISSLLTSITTIMKNSSAAIQTSRYVNWSKTQASVKKAVKNALKTKLRSFQRNKKEAISLVAKLRRKLNT